MEKFKKLKTGEMWEIVNRLDWFNPRAHDVSSFIL